jgi:hypothetical protein
LALKTFHLYGDTTGLRNTSYSSVIHPEGKSLTLLLDVKDATKFIAPRGFMIYPAFRSKVHIYPPSEDPAIETPPVEDAATRCPVAPADGTG